MVQGRIEGGRLRVTPGVGKDEFWNEIPWIKASVEKGTQAQAFDHRMQMAVYGLIATVILASALYFAFWRRREQVGS
jgi:hypothetical protein